jgi:hypothetical protein
VPHQRYDPTRDPDWWHRGYQRGVGKVIEYDPRCKVCGAHYRRGTYASHAKKPAHKAALVPKHPVRKR